MISFVARRTARLLVTLLAVSFLMAMMPSLLPGDSAEVIASADFNVNEEKIERVREDLGLDRAIPVRWAHWTINALQGDLGQSYRGQQQVLDAISDRLPVTIELMVVAQLMALAFALVVAPLASSRPGSIFDRITTALTFASVSVPTFISGLLLIYLLAVRFNRFPATGYVPLTDNIGENLHSLVLPALALAAPSAAIYCRLLRTEMLATLHQDYILTARLKGLSSARILYGHALRPSSLPLVTIAGLNVAAMIGGSVVVETLFALPGIGRLTIDSILARDFLVVQGIVVVVTITYVVINFIVDLLYAALDPRVRG